MIAVVLKERFFPDRGHYAPMDAAALDRYRFFARLGFFGIEPGTPRGAMRFLRVAEALESRSRATLWITAQGRFADPRERPVALAAGVGHVAQRIRAGSIIPLAAEYPFWDERTPEALVAFGEAIPIAEAAERTPEEWTRRIEAALAATQDVLAAAAIRRDAAAFDTVLAGTSGVGGVYDRWRSFRARLRGERFRPEHGDPRP